MIWLIVLMVLALGCPSSAFADLSEVTSPPYQVVVQLSYESPYVPDGRSSFKEFVLHVVFENVRFLRYPAIGGSTPFQSVRGRLNGEGFITYRLNPVVGDDGKPHQPKVISGFKKSISAALQATKTDPLVMDPVVPIGGYTYLHFFSTWEIDMMKWEYERGREYLSVVGVMFKAEWDTLRKGKPLLIELDYVGSFPEDKGKWWIDFKPVKKK